MWLYNYYRIYGPINLGTTVQVNPMGQTLEWLTTLSLSLHSETKNTSM